MDLQTVIDSIGHAEERLSTFCNAELAGMDDLLKRPEPANWEVRQTQDYASDTLCKRGGHLRRNGGALQLCRAEELRENSTPGTVSVQATLSLKVLLAAADHAPVQIKKLHDAEDVQFVVIDDAQVLAFFPKKFTSITLIIVRVSPQGTRSYSMYDYCRGYCPEWHTLSALRIPELYKEASRALDRAKAIVTSLGEKRKAAEEFERQWKYPRKE